MDSRGQYLTIFTIGSDGAKEKKDPLYRPLVNFGIINYITISFPSTQNGFFGQCTLLSNRS